MRTVLAILIALSVVAPARGAEQTVLGKRLVVKDPGAGAKRRIVLRALEKSSPNALVGDPTTGGATLTVRTRGANASGQRWTLPAAFWTGTAAAGFTYKDPNGTNGAVKRARLRRTRAGTVTVEAIVVGRLGPVTVLPPNAGTGGCASLAVQEAIRMPSRSSTAR